MRQRLFPLGLLLLTLSGGACHAPVTIVTPQGQAAYQADQVVLRLQELSNVVIADTGTQPGNITPADAFTIIEWISGDNKAVPPTTGVVQIIQTTAGQGWKVGAKQSYTTRVRAILLRYPALAAYVSIVDSLLEVV